ASCARTGRSPGRAGRRRPRCPVPFLATPQFLLLRMRSAATAAAVGPDGAPGGGGRGELAELVPDHALGDEDRDVLAAVVHGDRVPHHLGEERRGGRTGRNDTLVSARGTV